MVGRGFPCRANASLDVLRLELFFRGDGNPKIRLFQTGRPIDSFGFFALGVDPVHPEIQTIPDFFPPGSPLQVKLVGDLEYRNTPVAAGVHIGTGIYDYQPDTPLPLEAGRDYVFLLLTDPNLWLAAILRRRGATMAWTPGLVLDYARLLRVIVQRQDQRWFVRLGKAISGYRRAATAPSA